MKKYLFVMKRLPYIGSHVQEALDMILTTAAFDQTVSLLFVDDGVYQIKAGQNPGTLLLKQTAEIFKALDIYDINALYVESESLQERGLAVSELILPVKTIKREQINALMVQHDIVIAD